VLNSSWHSISHRLTSAVMMRASGSTSSNADRANTSWLLVEIACGKRDLGSGTLVQASAAAPRATLDKINAKLGFAKRMSCAANPAIFFLFYMLTPRKKQFFRPKKLHLFGFQTPLKTFFFIQKKFVWQTF
jgi:hypothetical protein